MKKGYWEPEAMIARTKAVKSLSRLLQDQAGIQTHAIEEVYKVTESSWVLRAKVNGEPVILKRYLGETAAESVTNAKRELDHLETVFGDGNLQANRCLFAYPEIGLIVLSFAPGPRLDDKISELTGQRRKKLMTQSGLWLHRYGEGRQMFSAMSPGFWVKHLESKSIDHVDHSDDRLILAELLRVVRRRADTLRGASVLKAAIHGDFVGMNAHFHKGTIYGVDVQGEWIAVVARDAARFLVWQQMRDGREFNGRVSGICKEDWDAFLSSGVLPEKEWSTTLPFFVAEQFYSRALVHYGNIRQRKNCLSAIQALCSEGG